MIIGICGKAGSGKDTIANHLATHHEFTVIPFARRLKTMCARAFDVDAALFYNADLKERPFSFGMAQFPPGDIASRLSYLLQISFLPGEEGPREFYLLVGQELRPFYLRGHITPREILQVVGTDICRAYHEEIWVMQWEGERLAQGRPGNVVVPDVRFPNEMAHIWHAGGVVWQVERVGAQAAVGADHASEHEWASHEPDLVISNHGTLDELYAEVDCIVEATLTLNLERSNV